MNRQCWIWVLGIAVLVLFNGLIIEEEVSRSHSETVYLKLRPVDPRSLMQGDYMRLAYEVTVDISEAMGAPERDVVKDEGRAVLRVDEDRIARFERIYRGGELREDELLLEWTQTDTIHLEVESFMFQEGHADAYADAEYAEVKLSEDGEMHLTGLRDNDLEPIKPGEQ
jgi:uncharacterized membrane-anchored protein